MIDRDPQAAWNEPGQTKQSKPTQSQEQVFLHHSSDLISLLSLRCCGPWVVGTARDLPSWLGVCVPKGISDIVLLVFAEVAALSLVICLSCVDKAACSRAFQETPDMHVAHVYVRISSCKQASVEMTADGMRGMQGMQANEHRGYQSRLMYWGLSKALLRPCVVLRLSSLHSTRPSLVRLVAISALLNPPTPSASHLELFIVGHPGCIAASPSLTPRKKRQYRNRARRWLGNPTCIRARPEALRRRVSTDPDWSTA